MDSKTTVPAEYRHKSWIETCEGARGVLERFGMQSALQYLIRDKFFVFLTLAEQNAEYAAEVPAFAAEVKRIFTAIEIRDFLDELERTEFARRRKQAKPAASSSLSFKREIGPKEIERFARMKQLLAPGGKQ